MKETGKVWLGAGGAALVSVLAAVGIFLVLGTTEIEGFQAVLEGILKIVAVIMLTWMTIWMKRQGGNIRRNIKTAHTGCSKSWLSVGISVFSFYLST